MLKSEILLNQMRAADARPLLENAPSAISQSAELKPRWLTDLAELADQSGKPGKARQLLSQAYDLASPAGPSSLLALIELKRGFLLGDFEECDTALHHALDLARRQQDTYLEANALLDLGYIRLQHFRFDEAISWLEPAQSAATQIPSKILHEKCLGNLGWCYFRLGQPDRALELFGKAVAIATEIGMTDDQQRWLGNIGAIYYGRGSFDQAISYYSRARDLAAQVGNRMYVANWLNNITRAYIDQSNWDAAEKCNTLALESARAANAPWVQAYSRLNSGFIAAARTRTAEAEQDFHRALRLAETAHQPNVSWWAHSGLAALYRSQARLTAAQTEYAAAVHALDTEWLALSRDESKITFRSYLTDFYQDYVGFLAERNQKQKAFEAAESSRARLLAQRLEGSSKALPEFSFAGALRLARQTNCLLLSYWLGRDRSYLWAVSPKGIWQFVLPRESDLNTLVENHQRAVQNLEDPLADGNPASRELYRTLVGPIEPLARSAEQVVIVPDGRLHGLNFETLVAGSGKPHYWIDDTTVSLAPSLSVLHVAQPGPARRPRLLIVGDPLPADPRFPPLPHLKSEVREIASLFPGPDRAVYTAGEAYAEHFRQTNPRSFDAIHFAAHASANDESPLNSAIILSPHGGKYKLYVSDVAELRLDPQLVTISACRSAGSRAYSGEGLIGFAWAFLETGAHNVVAGAWNVDDAAAPLMMKQFYAAWREGAAPAAALRMAKLDLVRSRNVFCKPYYWGALEIFSREVFPSAHALGD